MRGKYTKGIGTSNRQTCPLGFLWRARPDVRSIQSAPFLRVQTVSEIATSVIKSIAGHLFVDINEVAHMIVPTEIM